MGLDRDRLRRASDVAIVAAAVAGGLYWFGRALCASLLPFVVGWVLSSAAHPGAVFLSRHTGMPLRRAQPLSLTLLLVACSAGVWFLLRRVFFDLSAVCAGGGAVLTAFLDRLTAAGDALSARFPFSLGETLRPALGEAAAFLLRAGGAWASALPGFLAAALVAVVAAYGFAGDPEGIRAAAVRYLPPPVIRALGRIRTGVLSVSFGYLRAYLLLLLLTFLLLAAGLSLLSVPYACLVAACVALADFLPVIGVGTVLVPWALFSLAGGDARTGAGLLVLFFTVTVVRQFVEPKLVGHTCGIHPLLSLFSAYAGLKLAGFAGLILAPSAAAVAKGLFVPSDAFEPGDRKG